MNNPKNRWRFLIAATLPSLLLVISFYFIVVELNKDIEFTENEINGGHQVRKLYGAMIALQQLRGLTEIKKHKNYALDDRLKNKHQEFNEILFELIESEDSKIYGINDKVELIRLEVNALFSNNKIKTESFRKFSKNIHELLVLITAVADRSNLILDPEIPSYYLMNIFVKVIPGMTEEIGKVRGILGRVSASNSISNSENLALQIGLDTLQKLEAELDSGREKIIGVEPAYNLLLKDNGDNIVIQVDKYIENHQAEMKSSRPQSQNKALTIFNNGTRIITGMDEYHREIGRILNVYLQDRRSALRNILAYSLIGALFTMAAIIYFVIGFYRANLSAIKKLTRFRATLDLTLDGILMFDPKTLDIFYANRGAAIQLGYNEEQLRKIRLPDIVASILEADLRDILTRRMINIHPAANIEMELCRKNGEKYPVEISLQYVDLPNDSPRFVTTIHDITQRKQSQDILRRYEQIVNSVSDYLAIISPDYRYLAINQQFLDAFDLDRETVIGSKVADIVGRDYFKNISKPGIDKALSGERDILQMWHESKYLELSYIPCRDDSGSIIGVISCSHDLTRQQQAQDEIQRLNKELEQRVMLRTNELQKANSSLEEYIEELKNTQVQLIQSEKMSSLGELVAGITQEIKKPVSSSVTAVTHLHDRITHYSKLYETDTLDRENFEQFLNMSEESTQIVLNNLGRIAELIRSFTQITVDKISDQRRNIFIKEYIEEVIHSLKAEFSHADHNIIIECPEALRIYTQPGAISQIITNLLMNSLMHGFENIKQGEIRLTVREANGFIEFIYKDNGKGLEDLILKNMFAPFYTTKRAHGNSGLGMYVVFNIVNKVLNGDIKCRSQPGHGVIFTISVPMQFDESELPMQETAKK